MSDFIDILNLHPFLKKHGINSTNKNIEEIYDDIHSNKSESKLLPLLNEEIHRYFSSLRIPDYVTLYDKLILSLQSKDVIFSFNWDPLLLQAYIRNINVGQLPKLHFLHGNVAVGICEKDKRTGHLGNQCSICKRPFTQSNLLYPISKKNYKDDSFITAEWDALDYYLNKSFILTIFGYSAPKTDIVAKKMMKTAWKNNSRFRLNEIEIIDIQQKNKVEENWTDFTHSHHYAVFKNIKHSLSFQYARRSCEHWGDAIMQNYPWSERNIPNYKYLEKLQNWIQPLIKEEINFNNNDVPIPPYRVKK